MTKPVTIEIVVRKTYQVEVEDDFDFDDEEALQNLAADTEAEEVADTEDWESVYVTDDDEGIEYPV